MKPNYIKAKKNREQARGGVNGKGNQGVRRTKMGSWPEDRETGKGKKTARRDQKKWNSSNALAESKMKSSIHR